jgi:thioredoxin reductase
MEDFDVAVIGAGSAGLQAGLTLGRMRRHVAVFSTEHFRNDSAARMHNFLGHDGRPPAELRQAARRDLDRYPTVHFVEQEVTSVDDRTDGFVLTMRGDAGPLRVRRVILATGVRDSLPNIPGLTELFGDVVAHCPYCHGYEFADAPVAILGATPHVPMLAALVERIATDITVLADATLPEQALADALTRMGVKVLPDRVTEVRRGERQAVRVHFADGATAEFGGMFVAPSWSQAAPFAQQLGLETAALGGVIIDAMGRTSRGGVYAAGDTAHHRELPMPLASVLTAAAAGLVAATSCDRDLALEDNGLTTAP